MVPIYFFSQEERALQTKVNNVIMKHAPILQILNMKFKKQMQARVTHLRFIALKQVMKKLAYNLI